jgi:predicted lipoprotein
LADNPPIHYAFLMSMKNLRYLLAILVITQLSGCKSDDDPSTSDNTKDRQEVLINWADNIIKPSYAGFKTKFDLLVLKADAFSVSPDNVTLSEFRTAWENAYIEWQKVELFEFGPADSQGMRSFFNIFPASTEKINTYITDPSQSLEVADSYSSQGFPALDYMINGIGADDDAIIAAYTSDENAAKRIAYLNRIVSRMSTILSSVITEWNGSYRDTFVSKTGLDMGSSFGKVVNAFSLEYERFIRSGKIGIPAGVFSSGVVQPDKVEAYYRKNISKTLALTANNASLNFFNGLGVLTSAEGPSFKTYLNALEAKDPTSGTLLATVIAGQFTEVNNSLDNLSENFSDEVQNNNVAMTDTYAAMQKLVRLLKLDMASAVSVTITYTDNDGD